MAAVCYAHNELPTVDSCSDCGRGLCPRCDELVRPPLCLDCLTHRSKTLRKTATDQALRAVVFAVFVGLLVWWTQAHLQLWLRELSAATGIMLHLRLRPDFRIDLAAGYLAAAAVYGIPFLRRHLPHLMLLMPLGDWVLYGLIQVAFGTVIGAVAFPFLIGKQIHTVGKTERIVRHVHCALLPPAPPLTPLHR